MTAPPNPAYVLGWTNQNAGTAPTDDAQFVIPASVVDETTKPTAGRDVTSQNDA